MVRRSPLIKLLVILTVATLIVGCGSGGEPTGETNQLRIAVPQDFGPLNIFAQYEEPLTELVYDKLLRPRRT